MLSSIRSTSTSTLGNSTLELFSLRKAQMLENFLKRIYYGGDEYRDRMLSLYGARIEDYRINRPKWLSSSLTSLQKKQEVANTGSAPGSASTMQAMGTRLATATIDSSNGDGYTDFCPEFGIIISITSLMPRASYDCGCYQNLQTTYTDFPIPQFANQMEECISNFEISRNGSFSTPFGYAPYGHAYRYRVDEVHGDFLDTKYDYLFSRFFGADDSTSSKLNYYFLHCRPALPMFVDTVLLNGQFYGSVKNNFLVERTLPTPVETI